MQFLTFARQVLDQREEDGIRGRALIHIEGALYLEAGAADNDVGPEMSAERHGTGDQ
jgi:hypothetical protein